MYTGYSNLGIIIKLEYTTHKDKAQYDLCPGTGECGEGDFACKPHSQIPIPKESFTEGTLLLPVLHILPSSKTLMLPCYTLNFIDISSEFHSSLDVLLTPTDDSKEPSGKSRKGEKLVKLRVTKWI